MFVALETSLPADPLALARRVWHCETPALLWSAVQGEPSYLACEPDAHASGLDPEPSLKLGAPQTRPEPWAGIPRWVGVLPYEQERARLERSQWIPTEQRESPFISRAEWWRYPAMCVIAERVTLVGEERAVQRLAQLLAVRAPATPRSVLSPLPGEPTPLHLERIHAALELIAQGDLYQVNLSRLLQLKAEGDALSWLEQMGRTAQPSFGAALELPSGASLVSTSPELFLRTYPNGLVETWPIKGTRPCGATQSEQEALALELDADEKERAELAMVVDVERNDLGRIAQIGSVRAEEPKVTAHGRVLHRAARVTAELRPGLSRTELLAATLPSGSVTGAPKIRAMEVIASLEAARRGIYTGALGYVAHDGCLQLAMAIRCLSVRGGLGHYHVGGGIVADSDAERELQETEWKSVQLSRLFRG